MCRPHCWAAGAPLGPFRCGQEGARPGGGGLALQCLRKYSSADAEAQAGRIIGCWTDGRPAQGCAGKCELTPKGCSWAAGQAAGAESLAGKPDGRLQRSQKTKFQPLERGTSLKFAACPPGTFSALSNLDPPWSREVQSRKCTHPHRTPDNFSSSFSLQAMWTRQMPA